MTMDNYEEILKIYFVYVGIVEDLQTSVNVLASRLGFPSLEIPRLHISQRDEEAPEKLREEFMNNNKLEYAIYNFALKITEILKKDYFL